MKTKKNPEIPMVPKAHLKTVEHQREQYKAERDILNEENEQLKEDIEFFRKLYHENLESVRRLVTQSKQLKQDISVLRANNEKLERENNNLKQSVSEYKDYAESHVANYLELKSLEHENKALRLQANTYFDEWQNDKKRIEELESEIDDRNEWDLLKMEQEVE